LLENPFVGSDSTLFEAAQADAEAGNLDDAVTKAKSLLKKHPHQWPLLFPIAAWLAEADRDDEAVAAIEVLVKGSQAHRDELDQLRALDSLATDERYLKLLEQIPATAPARLEATPFSAWQPYGINGLPVNELT